MNRHLRRALVALLVLIPVAAPAQQQQGVARDSDYLTRAKALVGSKHYKAALATFDSLLRAEPGSRDATLGRAQMLAWLGRLTDAVRAYERWVAAHPKDIEALELLARTLSWAGRLENAERIYKLLALGGSPEAERGVARMAAWRGDLLESERRWRAIVARRPGDVEAWIGLAQVLRWTNRPRAARTALLRALHADPGNRDATGELALVEAALAPHVDPSIASITDTDGNRVTTGGATFALAAPWEGELSVRAQHRGASLAATRASSLGTTLAASRATGRFALRGSVGATRLEDATATSGSATRDVVTGAAAVSARVSSRARVSADVSRAAFDETAPLIRRGIVSTAYGGGGSLDLSRRVTLSGEFEHARLTGATPNTRTGGSASLRWRAPFVLSLAASARGFGYSVDTQEGYFAPARYLLGEASARLAVGRDVGWSATLDGGFGAQSIDARAAGSATRPAARGVLGITFRPTPRLEWTASGNVTNAVWPGTATLASYRASGWGVRGRVAF